MAQEIRDESGHIRYIYEATVKEAGKDWFRVLNEYFWVKTDLQKDDRVRITIERILTNADE